MAKTKTDWRTSALLATGRNKSQFGAILACALDRNSENPSPFPRFEGKASVTSDGFAMCNFIDRNGQGHMGAFVGSVSDVKENARRLARHLQLGPRETLELIGAVNAWLGEAIEAKDA